MRIYCVGGAVRDELLGLPVKDRDYVVVGTTPEEMVRLGYKPVGRDFPVFLHPQTHEEYALARTERKTGPGYHGFVVHAAPDVTLEQDLARRDLTINAIAKDDAGRILDPHHGVNDLRAGILRHVGPAFAEVPVRILRVARFAARFGFRVASETLELMRAMARSGEADRAVHYLTLAGDRAGIKSVRRDLCARDSPDHAAHVLELSRRDGPGVETRLAHARKRNARWSARPRYPSGQRGRQPAVSARRRSRGDHDAVRASEADDSGSGFRQKVD